MQDRPAPGRPGGYQSAVPQDLARCRPAPEFPLQGSTGDIHAVEIAVVTDKVDLALAGDRGQTHRAASVERPDFFACIGVERYQTVARTGTEEQTLAQNHRFEDLVELHQVLIEGIFPCRLERGILPHPLQVELVGQISARGRAAAGVIAPHGPVTGRTTGTDGRERQKNKRANSSQHQLNPYFISRGSGVCDSPSPATDVRAGLLANKRKNPVISQQVF